MKKIILIQWVLVLALFVCDPVVYHEPIFKNSTDNDLKIHFVSAIVFPELENNTDILTVTSGSSHRYSRLRVRDGGSDGDGSISLTDVDSIYITDMSDRILKVYKEHTDGKNMYNIDEYWEREKASKSLVEYTYEITDEDIKQE